MRSKEVEEAIKNFEVYNEMVRNHNPIDVTIVNPNDFKKDIDTVLVYIEELEEKAEGKILFARGNTKTPILVKIIEEVNKGYVDKQVIRDKIKELENMRDTSITSEAFNIFNGEIIVLKELLGG